jgi:hypothetical protein
MSRCRPLDGFMLCSAHCRDHDGRKRFAGQWEDAIMPVATAQCALRHAARDLLMPYGDLLIVLSTLLRIKRTLDGAEIDKIIWEFEAQKALAAERRRRADWRKRELAASRFRAECDHLKAARSPHLVRDQVS